MKTGKRRGREGRRDEIKTETGEWKESAQERCNGIQKLENSSPVLCRLRLALLGHYRTTRVRAGGLEVCVCVCVWVSFSRSFKRQLNKIAAEPIVQEKKLNPIAK